MAQPNKRRPVTTAFVRRGDGKVLVVKRSDKVRTYPGLWGGVSGGVEGEESILHRALTEVYEETGLTKDQVRLVATGRPLPVDDAGRQFLVYPFLLRTVEENLPLTLNWENVDTQWVDHSQLEQLPTVPRLPATLERLCLPQHMQCHVDAIKEDREHGAAELAVHVLDAFDAAMDHEDEQGVPESGMEAWLDFAYRLATCRPSMAALANAACDVMLRLEEELQGAQQRSTAEIRASLRVAVQQVRERASKAKDALASQAEQLLAQHKTVMTLSYSSTVVAGIVHAAHRQEAAVQEHKTRPPPPTGTTTAPAASAEAPEPAAAGRTGEPASFASTIQAPAASTSSKGLQAIVLESRPLNEGLKMAQRLADAGITTTIITDAQAAVFVRQADVVVIGADCITEDGAVNKVGSHLVALAAHEAQVPVYAVADTSKISPGPVTDLVLPNTALAAGHEEKDAAEVTACWSPEAVAMLSAGKQEKQQEGQLKAEGGAEQKRKAPVDVRNVYFELVPTSLLAGVVTEIGVMNSKDIAAAVEERRQQYLKAFDVTVAGA